LKITLHHLQDIPMPALSKISISDPHYILCADEKKRIEDSLSDLFPDKAFKITVFCGPKADGRLTFFNNKADIYISVPIFKSKITLNRSTGQYTFYSRFTLCCFILFHEAQEILLYNLKGVKKESACDLFSLSVLKDLQLSYSSR